MSKPFTLMYVLPRAIILLPLVLIDVVLASFGIVFGAALVAITELRAGIAGLGRWIAKKARF